MERLRVSIDLLETRVGARLFRIALLHVVLEESDISAEELGRRVDPSDEDLEILKLFSRNYVAEGENYTDKVVKNELATIVKLMDRIANFEDLFLRVNKVMGFNPESSKIAFKYVAETVDLLSNVEKQYPKESKDWEYPLRYQSTRLKDYLMI
ncbi:MAG: hypothetical protein GX020_06345 [Firmicutes bacterium]|nr:hypothetical protein [Bacillota bacterium]